MSVDIEKLIQNDLEEKINKPLRERALREYYSNPNRCQYCDEIIIVGKSEASYKARKKKFCNSSCAASYNNQGVRRNSKDDVDYDSPNRCINCNKEIPRVNKYCSHRCQLDYEQAEWENKWIAGEVSGNKNSDWIDTKDRVRTYLFNKYDKKCSQCGWGQINPYTNTIPLEIHHIDGNPYNTVPDNLDLLCPNCHSLTNTYRGANKGNGRKKPAALKTTEVEF